MFSSALLADSRSAASVVVQSIHSNRVSAAIGSATVVGGAAVADSCLLSGTMELPKSEGLSDMWRLSRSEL